MDIIQNTKPQDSSPPLTPHSGDLQSETVIVPVPPPPPIEVEIEKPRRRLRSSNAKVDIEEQPHDVAPISKENLVPPSIASTSSGRSTPNASFSILKSILPLNIGITNEGREILKKTLSWEIIPSSMPTKPSMIYGAAHLARLIGMFY